MMNSSQVLKSGASISDLNISQNGIMQIRTKYPSDSKVTKVNFIFEVTETKVYTSEE